MGNQTIISVPDWAYSAVGQYVNAAFNYSQGNPDIPSVVITAGYGGVAQAILGSGGIVASINVISEGYFYSSPPVVTLIPDPSDTTGGGATARATVSGGFLTSITVITPGIAYVMPPTVVITAMGSGVSATCVLAGDIVNTITLINGGNNFAAPPSVTIIGGRGEGALAVAVLTGTTVDTLEVTNQGSGYLTAPTVVFTGGSPGTPAAATAVLGTNVGVDTDKVVSITVTNHGVGYEDVPVISFTGGSGSNAAATAHLVPTSVASFVVTNGGSGYLSAASQFTAYGGTIIAPQDSNETGGIARLATRGANGNTTIKDAKTLADSIINGGKLTGLPSSFLLNLSTKEIAAFAQISALIGKKSLYAGDPDITLLAQTLVVNTPATYIARLEARLEADNYQSERGSMDVAIGLGIELAKQSILDAETLRKAGLYAREYTQGTYELSHKLFIETEEMNVYKLEILGNALRAITGSQQTTTSNEQGASALMSAVGIVSAAAGVYNALNAAGIFTAAATTTTETGTIAGGGEIAAALAAIPWE